MSLTNNSECKSNKAIIHFNLELPTLVYRLSSWWLTYTSTVSFKAIYSRVFFTISFVLKVTKKTTCGLIQHIGLLYFTVDR